MELVAFDEKKKEYTIKMSQRDFLDLFDIVGGVYSTAGLQDFTALGATEERVLELSEKLRALLKEDLLRLGLCKKGR